MSYKNQGFRLIVAGVLLIAIFGAWRFNRVRILSFSKEYPQEISASIQEASKPTFVEISRVGIKLKVEESGIVNGVWEISYDGASHLDKSASSGENGNVVIYGHNKNELFGPIRWLKEGDLIEVTSEGEKKYVYEVKKSFVTSPEDIEHVLPKDKETLTLYTCTGFLDSKRHIVIAEPKTE